MTNCVCVAVFGVEPQQRRGWIFMNARARRPMHSSFLLKAYI